MSIQIVFETHSISEDNEQGIATGWNHGQLSKKGRTLAAELGRRRRDDGIQAVFTSDLRRAVETAELALGNTPIPIFYDWRLRECDYGRQNGTSAMDVHQNRQHYLETPYPGGESWRQAVYRVGRFLPDLHTRWEGVRVLMIGHVATRWALEYYLNDVPLENLIDANFDWRAGWEYFMQ